MGVTVYLQHERGLLCTTFACGHDAARFFGEKAICMNTCSLRKLHFVPIVTDFAISCNALSGFSPFLLLFPTIALLECSCGMVLSPFTLCNAFSVLRRYMAPLRRR